MTAESFLIRIPEGTQPIKQTVGVARASQGKCEDSVRHRDATELLKLIRLLLETLGKVIKICRVFGVRSKEAAFITHATEEDGELQLRVAKGKTYNTRGRIKGETDPRWLEAVAVDTMREVNTGHKDHAVVAALEPQLIQRSGIVW